MFNRNFNKMSEKHFGPVHEAMAFFFFSFKCILKLLLHSGASPFSPLKRMQPNENVDLSFKKKKERKKDKKNKTQCDKC